ncbi:MAG: alpha/beta hydrolase [Luteolibacter sp.]
MNVRLGKFMAAALGLMAAGVAGAAEDPPLPPIAPQDAMLTEYAYPFEVKIRKFQSLGQPLEMAYMDLRPEKPNGKSVLLLHGKNFSGAYWEKTARALADGGYRVVMPDQIGFGKSSKPTAYPYTFQALASNTRALLDELGIERANVVGHSMGGMIAARFALMFPDKTAKLVLVNPLGLEDWKRLAPYQPVDDATVGELKKTPQAVRDYMKKAYFDGKWQSSYDPLLAIQAGWTIGPDREQMARVGALTSDMIFTQPVAYEFPDIRVPTLLIIGDRDRTAIGKERATQENAARMGRYDELGKTAAAAIPGAKLVTIPGVGHCPQVEAFDDYLKALSGFLGEK